MWYFVFASLGMIAGGICVYVAFLNRQQKASEKEIRLQEFASSLDVITRTLDTRQKELENRDQLLKRSELQFDRLCKDIEAARTQELEEIRCRLLQSEDEFRKRVITYDELSNENLLLKRDLRNLAVAMRKLELDQGTQRERQDAIDGRAAELGSRYLKESVKWISASINQNNYANCKQRLLDVIERCRGIGLSVPAIQEASLLADLKLEFEKAVKAAFEREEQARIKAQIREEQLREREIQRELKQLDREREAIKAALENAIIAAHGQFNEEISRLQQRLAEAEARSQRAISQAQLTKAGFLYVISNLGSFGESVYKIGMTRRLEPYDRVRELGDASVPFPFDVHMMISCNDAPALENALHRALHKLRLNRVNPRKEFFKVDLGEIARIVRMHHGEIEYRADAEALEYRQSLSMSEEDMEYIEHVFEDTEDEVESSTPDCS